VADNGEHRIPVASDADVITARQRARALAAGMGFPVTDRTLIATAVSELARNIVAYAGSGVIAIRIVEERGKRGLIVVAEDQGPGIANVPRALERGFSTSGGLGLGLPGVRQLGDEFEIESRPGQGTRITVRKWMHV
jgi:serine/threonine-protein kinase RsbT